MKTNNSLLVLALCLFALCSNAQESPLQTRFDQQYQQLVTEISKQEDAAAELEQLKAVWLATRKRLISINADIDAKKLDVSVSSGQQQSGLIDELVAMGGLRERTLIDGIGKLQNIHNGETVEVSEIGAVEVEAADAGERKGGSGKSGVIFSIEPEDVGNSGLP